MIGLDEVNEREINADELVILGSSATQTVVPENPAFGFLGAPGEVVHVLPQEETEGVIFLGIAGDEIESGVVLGISGSLFNLPAAFLGEQVMPADTVEANILLQHIGKFFAQKFLQ